jgi:enterochelin esterase family protein
LEVQTEVGLLVPLTTRLLTVAAICLTACYAPHLAAQEPAAMSTRITASAARLQSFTLFDSAYRRSRQIWIYTPADYASHAAQTYPLLVSFDGYEYRETMPLPFILDTLVATGRAPAFVAVLIDDGSRVERIDDLGNARKMVDFLAGQLLPWVRAHYQVTTDPSHVIISGSSAGGLASAFVAIERPELFGNVLSQSGAFWRGAEASNSPPYEWLTGEVVRRPKRDVRFFMDVGALEFHTALGGAAPSIRDANRRLRDALVARGYAVTYTEVPGGQHAPEYWRLRLPVGIVTLTSGWH